MMHERIWEDQIAINSQDEPVFETVPPVAEIDNRDSYTIDADALDLPEPLQSYIQRDVSRLPVADDREGYYGPRHFEYWLSGLKDAQHAISLADKFGSGRDICVELGAASGRVIRHLGYRGLFRELYAFDINWKHVCWVNRYLPRNIVGIQNSSIPTLPLGDNSVDLFTAESVFTHVEIFELHWLAEIKRILKPGGVAKISFMTDDLLTRMTPSWPVYGSLVHHGRWNDNVLADLSRQGKMVFRWHADRSYSSNVVYDEAYLHNVLGRLFEVHRQPLHHPTDTQTIYALVKR